MKYSMLFSKAKIGSITLKNRVVMAPMMTAFADFNGEASARLVKYYEERAKGGVGLIYCEGCGVDAEYGQAVFNQLNATSPKYLQKLDQLTQAVHKYDAKIFAQLHHPGAVANPAITGNQNLSPSGVVINPAFVPRAMEAAEIKTLVIKYAEAAGLCKLSGFDGVEIHAAHGYLLTQFLSPYFNKRTDEYGGSLENRMRFLSEIYQAIRTKVGPAFPITVRISGDEMTPDIPGTLTLDDGIEIAKHIEKLGAAAINVSNGNIFNRNANCEPFSYTPGWKQHVAKAIKEAISIPVIATNTIKSPEFAEQTLANGVCDFVVIGRGSLADPEWSRKAEEGREDEIRQCIGCMYCRETLIGNGFPVRCQVNPRLGCEGIFSEYEKNGRGRQVIVVGGGPAGMEAARVLAEREFKVTLFEKTGSLGGTLNLANKPPFKDILTGLTKTMAAQIEKLGVEIRLNMEATPAMVKALNPVGVFLAAGAGPIIPPIEGVTKDNVHTAEEVAAGQVKLSGTVAVIGLGMTGLEVTEMLLDQGCKVAMVEMMDKVGPGVYAVLLDDIMGRINKYSPIIYLKHMLAEIENHGVVLTDLVSGKDIEIAADYVVLSLGVAPCKGLVEEYEVAVDKVVAIGDAEKGGRIYNAIKNGFDKAFVFASEKI